MPEQITPTETKYSVDELWPEHDGHVIWYCRSIEQSFVLRSATVDTEPRFPIVFLIFDDEPSHEENIDGDDTYYCNTCHAELDMPTQFEDQEDPDG